MRSTHTYVVLGISADAFAEIEKKLRAADYHHCFGDGVIDMSGIAVAPRDPKTLMPPDHWVMRAGDNIRPVPIFTVGTPGTNRQAVRAALVDAARFAIRGATANGTILDFDPNAMVANFLLAVIGPCGEVTERVR